MHYNYLSHAWYAVWAVCSYQLCTRLGPAMSRWLHHEMGFSSEMTSFFWLGLMPMLVYYGFGALLAGVDLIVAKRNASWTHARRMQLGTQLPTRSDFTQVLRVATLNWLCIGLPVAALLSWVVVPWREGLKWASHPPPAPAQLALTVLIEELCFYGSHRLFHTHALYAAFHKLHHQYTAPFGFAAVYAHPLEHLLSNVLPVALGPLLTGMSPHLACAWSVLAVINTMVSHCGWKLPGMHDPSSHDWHHLTFTENYGVLGLCDWLAGSDVRYRAALREGRFALPRGPGGLKLEKEKGS